MILKVINHPYEFDMKNLCTVFFPFEKIKDDGEDGITVVTSADKEVFTVYAGVRGKELEESCVLSNGEDGARIMSVLLYNVLSRITGYKPPWGILFGVRPAKLMHRLSDELGEEGAKKYFTDSFLVSEKKANLVREVVRHENKIIPLSGRNSFSLYVSIPFCPTRCSYCSFVSHSVEKTKRLVDPYVKLLCRELEETGRVAEKLNLKPQTVYFGGGTPTVLSVAQLNMLFDTIKKSFDLSSLLEYTVEAGRPDTVTEGRLYALKEAGVTRISINPQSFNDSVLNAIGRRHTSRQTVDAFQLATQCGFDNINMDLIAGLPLDTPESFEKSVNTAVALKAQSVTVHTLALKTASYMAARSGTDDFRDRETAARMVDYSSEFLTQSGYYPYYMYRQSKSVGNLENVGWCRASRDCLYNVFMMDETHSVLAAGAGAVTRLKNPDTGHIDRIYNYKYPYEYIDNFDEIIRRKNSITDYLGE